MIGQLKRKTRRKSSNWSAKPGSREEILSILQNLQKEIYAPVQTIIENYNDDLATEKELLQVKEYYYKKKYLHRLLQQLTGKK